MENEIKVNDYVRIAGGIIARVTNKNKDGLLIDRVIRDPMRQDGTIRDWCIFNDEKRLIIKHSKNIIDLIEVGDYVNGYKVIDIMEDLETGEIHLEMPMDYTNTELGDCTIYNNDIKTIVTKEQFENISYKVERKD